MAALREAFDVSVMTLWRDLARLEEAGLIRRLRGGAAAVGDTSETSISVKSRRHLEAKKRIARAAVARFVKSGLSLIVDGGSTVAEVCPLLAGRNVTVLTHSLTILSRMQAAAPGVNCHASGGMLRPVSGTFVGPDAVRFFRRKQADIFFMTATGLDRVHGLTDPNPLEIEVKLAMVQAAKMTVLLIDASKIGVASICPVAPLRRISAVVTDATGIVEEVPALRGTELVFVRPVR